MRIWVAWLAACRPGDEETIEARCELTDNVLRARCEVTVDPPQAISLRYGTPERAVDSEQERSTHLIELSLLQPETEYDFVARSLDGSVETSGSFLTGSPPQEVRSWLVVTGQSSVPLVGTETPCSNAAYAVIYDTTTGALVWYELLDQGGQLGPMDMIQFTEDRTVLGETGGKIVEVDLSGRVLLELVQGDDFHDLLHHDLFKRDGLIYALRMVGVEQLEPGYDLLLDGFYVFDASTGELVDAWDAPSFLPIPEGATGDFMHTNSIWVDDSGIYLSLLAQSSILKLAADGTPLWTLAGAGPAALGNDFTVDWGAVVPSGFREQHAVRRLQDGTLLLLDNAHGRALALTLDEEARQATVRAEYSAATPMCGPQGTATVTSSGNVLVGCLSNLLQEYTPAGEVAWTASVRGCPERPAAARYYPLEGWEF